MIDQARARFLSASLALSLLAAASLQAAPASFYPQAEPSAQEQVLLELINKARSNPAAEGQMLASVQDPEILRYYSHYGVNASKLQSDFASYSAKPPLAFNAKLMASSRAHSIDQATKGFQGHDGTDGSHFDSRIIAQGYAWHALGENVFAYVQTPFFGHVGLNADWGVADLDHRANIMNSDASFPTYKEIGISCVASSVKGFGPLVITQDFGCPADPNAAFVTGVIYADKNGNGAYDEGEGLGGVQVAPDQGEFFTTTSASGGYSLPLPTSGSGTLSITVSGGAIGAAQVQSVAFVSGTNVKADFTANDNASTKAANGGGSAAGLPEVSVSAAQAEASTDGSQAGVIVIKRKGNSAQALEVALSVSGTAVSGVDFVALPGTVSIPAGAKSVSLSVQGLNASFDGIKKVKVKAAPAQGYVVNATSKANVRILGQAN
jgi:hypothetical protein